MVALTPKGYKRNRKKTTKNVGHRNQMVEQYLPLVRTIASDVCASTSANVEYDDLFSTGIFGLIDAVKNYDPDRNVKFGTYCKRRIRGAMLDELRQLDWVPRLARQQRSQVARAEKSLQSRLDRRPSEEEMAQELDVDIKSFRKMEKNSELVNLFSLDSIIDQDDGENSRYDSLEDPKSLDPVSIIQKKDSHDFISRSLGKIEKMILSLYYYEQMTMRQIGAALNISESRVSQIHTEMLSMLRERILTDKEEFVLAL